MLIPMPRTALDDGEHLFTACNVWTQARGADRWMSTLVVTQMLGNRIDVYRHRRTGSDATESMLNLASAIRSGDRLYTAMRMQPSPPPPSMTQIRDQALTAMCR